MVIWDQKPRASHRLSSGAGHPKARNLNQTTRHHGSVLHGGHIAIPLGMKEKLWRLADASQSLRNIIFCCLWLMLDDIATRQPPCNSPLRLKKPCGWFVNMIQHAEHIMERCFALFRNSASIKQQIRNSRNGGKKLPQVHMSQGRKTQHLCYTCPWSILHPHSCWMAHMPSWRT